MRNILLLFASALLLSSCNNTPPKSETPDIDTLQGESLLGVDLISRPLDKTTDSVRIANFIKAKADYEADPDGVDALVWYGRRMAYLGDYRKAIDIFTEGTQKHPDNPEFYRHRGHRYITLRMFDEALADFEKAALLIEGKPDMIEPDGVPNARNTPISTLHSNIWYHYGLTYFLMGDMENALEAFRNSFDAESNPDKLVSSTNWIYMILRRMERDEEAIKALEPINAGLDIIENMAYHQLCLFYKGEITEEELKGQDQGTGYMNEAVAYGVANWHLCNGDSARAESIFREITEKGNWASFGFISAEADLARKR